MNNRKLVGFTFFLSLGTSFMAGANNMPDIYPWSSEQDVLVTETWLDLQREGQAGSRHIQAVTLAEQEKIMQRWLKSYENPMPGLFNHEPVGDIVP